MREYRDISLDRYGLDHYVSICAEGVAEIASTLLWQSIREDSVNPLVESYRMWLEVELNDMRNLP